MKKKKEFDPFSNTEIVYLRIPTSCMRIFRKTAKEMNLSVATYIRIYLTKSLEEMQDKMPRIA